ncbi:MAG: hypothetical protein WA919_02785 [Coleofasciculaceae cyanobacterium]
MTETQREAYYNKVKAEVDKVNAQIAEMNAKAEQAKADAKIQYHSQVEELETKKAAMDVKLKELQLAGEDAWSEMQKGVEAAWNDLQAAFNNASAKFK